MLHCIVSVSVLGLLLAQADHKLLEVMEFSILFPSYYPLCFFFIAEDTLNTQKHKVDSKWQFKKSLQNEIPLLGLLPNN